MAPGQDSANDNYLGGGRSTRTRGEAHADATETTKEAVTSIEEKASVNTKRSNAATTVGKYDRQ